LLTPVPDPWLLRRNKSRLWRRGRSSVPMSFRDASRGQNAHLNRSPVKRRRSEGPSVKSPPDSQVKQKRKEKGQEHQFVSSISYGGRLSEKRCEEISPSVVA